jgi:N-acetylmuramoyl-L-alanine amidase
MKSRKIIYIFILLFISLAAMGMNSAPKTAVKKVTGPQQLFAKADQFRNSLTSSPKLMRQRQNWLNCISKYQQIYEKYPKSEQAPLALFQSGVLYRKLFKYSSLDEDLDKALNLFERLTDGYKTHQLADDAQYQRGDIYYHEKNDLTQAYVEFLKLDVNFSSGDMKPKAKAVMDELSAKLGKKEATKAEAAAAPASGAVTVKKIRTWSTPTYTRIVIDTDGPAKYTSDLLKEDAAVDKVKRIYVDVENSHVTSSIETKIPIKDGLLQGARAEQYNAGTVRVVLDLNTISGYKIFPLFDPFRIVIDVQGGSSEEKEARKEAPAALTPGQASDSESSSTSTPGSTSGSASSPASTPGSTSVSVASPTPASNPGSISGARTARRGIYKPEGPDQSVSLAGQLGLTVRRIVIDPGHGGKDPGCEIEGGIQEKDITLDLAKRLAAALQKKLVGCEVMLTRDKDVFIPLDERTAFANVNKADLFISLHVNAHKRNNVFGLETYFLNMATDESAVMVAARENATSEKNISDCQAILNDLMLNTKISESSKLAYQVQNGMMAGIKKAYKVNKSLGVKQAPFYVLIGAEMPAVLIETGFITNPTERKRIMSNSYKNLLTDGIATGIKSYINTIAQAYNIGFTAKN